MDMRYERNREIDGLRGIAALLVVLYHMFCRYQQIYLGKNVSFAYVDYWGDMGVAIFFVISGLYIVKDSNQFSIFEFCKLKFVRLWPTYFVAISIIFVVTNIHKLPERTCSFWEYILNIFWFNGFVGIEYVDSAHWYITSLVGIYIVLAIIQKYCKKREYLSYNIWILLSLLCYVVQIHCNTNMVAKLLYLALLILGGRHISLFIIGIVLNALLLRKERRNKWHIITLFIASVYQFVVHSYVGLIILLIAVGLVILCAKNVISFVGNKLFVYFGTISYSVYVIHQNVGFCIQREIQQKCGQYEYFIPLVTTIIVIFLGTLLHVIVEKNSKKIFRKIGVCL